MFFLRKYLTEIIAASLLVIGFLALANLVKFGYLSKNLLVQNKDLIDVIGTIVTSSLLVLGAIVAYYRFFRGRTFSVNANVNMDVSIHETNQDFLLHVVNIELANKGAFPIWEPSATLFAYPHGMSDLNKVDEVNLWIPKLANELKDHIQVVYAGETEQFYAFHRVPRTIWAVTYVVQMTSRGKSRWIKTVTVSNKVKEPTQSVESHGQMRGGGTASNE